MQLITKGKELLATVKTYWKKPPAGKYMNYKEIAAYSIGGVGAYFIFTMAQQLLLSTTNVIIGNTIGIQPIHIYVMYVISQITNIPLTALRANMIDNVKYKEGKYRPYLLRMGIPTAIISMLFVFTPYTKVSYIWRCILIFVYNFGLQFFYNFFYDSYENLIHVLSPNSQERTNVTAIKSQVYSLSPTVTNFIIPLIAGKVSEGNIYDLRVYQWLYPFIAVGGILFCILVYANTEEKIVQAKTHVVKVRFSEALREVAKNKYFWIIALAGWVGFLESASYSILQWLYNYGHLCTDAQYSFITLIHGNASFWGMLAAPFAVKKWGKKKVLVVTNLMNICFLACMYPVTHSIWAVLVFMFMNSMMNAFAVVLTPTIQADIRDFQQYKTGERIDGMFAAVGLIGGFVTMATSSVLPAFYEKYGIFAGNGYDNMYDVLYDPEILYTLVGVLILLSVLGAAMNVIPFFFYDLTELKQQTLIRILQVRALFEDYGNNALKDRELCEAIELIRNAETYATYTPKDLNVLKAAKKAKGLSKEEKKAAKKAYKEAVEFNNEIVISKAVMAELERFNEPMQQQRLENAKKVAAMGLKGITNVSDSELTDAEALSTSTKEEKEHRKDMVDFAKLRIRCKKATEKFYPDGITEFDPAIFDTLYEEETALNERQLALSKELGIAKKSGDKQKVADVKAQLKASNDERYIISGKIKAAEKQNSLYHSCAKSYLDAKKLILQAENYTHYEEIEAMYDEIKSRLAEEEA